ncbi:MAG TPA: response regulator transcription factor, partial [Bacteroidota bacterium]|nr:response regulator transcription factor [Bacteroidota bacterium]
QGRKYVTASLAQQLVDEIDVDSQRSPHELLSDREFQVLCLLGQGKSVTEAADALKLSIPTVSTYRARILDKMKLNSTAQLIVYALEHKLIKNP